MDAPGDFSFGGVGKVLIADGESGDTGLVVFLLVLVVFGGSFNGAFDLRPEERLFVTSGLASSKCWDRICSLRFSAQGVD